MISKQWVIFSFILLLNVSVSFPLISFIKSHDAFILCNSSNFINSSVEINREIGKLSSKSLLRSLTIKCHDKRHLSITPHSFSHNFSSQRLSFHGLSIEILPNSFVNHKFLHSITFTNCIFIDFRFDSFGSIPNAIELDLSHNSLQYLPKNHTNLSPFTTKITQLNLSHNRLSRFSKSTFDFLSNFTDRIDLTNNSLSCHCDNRWILNGNYNKTRLKIDRLSGLFGDCRENQLGHCFNDKEILEKIVFPFESVIIDCPINSSHNNNSDSRYWMGPNKELINDSRLIYRYSIQPIFLETEISLNRSTGSLKIVNFRGHFMGNWSCFSTITNNRSSVVLIIGDRIKPLFDFSIAVGFGFAGVWLLIATAVGLIQYCRETSCCRKKIDYNKSHLFEKRYIPAVIPVPVVDSVSGSLADPSSSVPSLIEENEEEIDESDCSKPLNRIRYESHSNDVQLIFKDEQLAEEYARMLSQLKEASETGDERFKDRLTTLRTRFSLDFSKMRFELKRGMEQLKSNSSAAAHKLRKSVGHMKDHMKSLSEFCGTSSMAQSISIVVISNDSSNTNDPFQSGGSHERHEQKVFRFFDPL